jgi:hypothetical protein
LELQQPATFKRYYTGGVAVCWQGEVGTADTSSPHYPPLPLRGASPHAKVRDLRAVLLPLGSSTIPRESETDWSQPRESRKIADTRLSLEKLPPTLTNRVQGVRSRQIRRSVRRKNLEPALGRFGFDVLGSCLATVPAKQLRQRARERTKTRVSLAGQIHCGYLTQLHVGAGPVRERPYTRTGLTVPQLTRYYTGGVAVCWQEEV